MAETKKLILKLMWNYKGIQKPKTTLKGLKTKIFYLKTSYIQFNTTGTKTVWNWHKARDLDQWNRIEAQNKFIHHWTIYFQQDYSMEEIIVTSTKSAGTIGYKKIRMKRNLDVHQQMSR